MPNATFPPPLAVLAFLGAVGATVLLLGVAGWAAVRRRRVMAGRALAALGVLLASYATVLIAVSLASRDRILAEGEEKYFCEIDCHLAYHVAGVRVSAEGGSSGPTEWTVTLVTRFDPTTTSPRRPAGAPNVPGPRLARLRFDDGREVAGAPAGGTPLKQELRPGESYESELRFLVPAGARPTSVVLLDDFALGRLLIGSERSPLHGKVLLPIPGRGHG